MHKLSRRGFLGVSASLASAADYRIGHTPVILILMLTGVTAAAPQQKAATERYELSNDSVQLVLDDQGRLVELSNRQTGRGYLANAARHAPWRMHYRLNTPLDGALDLEIPTDGQKARVARTDNCLELSYESLTGSLPQEHCPQP